MPFQPFPLCSHFSCCIKWQYFLGSWDSIFSTWAVCWVPGLFIYLFSSDVWLQSPDQELCPENCPSGLFFIVCCISTSKSTWPNCHATIYPQNLFTVLCPPPQKNMTCIWSCLVQLKVMHKCSQIHHRNLPIVSYSFRIVFSKPFLEFITSLLNTLSLFLTTWNSFSTVCQIGLQNQNPNREW